MSDPSSLSVKPLPVVTEAAAPDYLGAQHSCLTPVCAQGGMTADRSATSLGPRTGGRAPLQRCRHATRTVVECIELGRVDRIVLASLLDARFLAGSCALHAMLDGDVRQTVKEAGAKALAAALAPPVSTPHGPIANDEPEPDVKRGPGALRDIQRLQGLARVNHVRTGYGARSELARPDVAVPRVLADARRFLWQVRCHLHLLAGRAQDRLVRELQPLVARRLGLGRGPDTGAAELMARHHAYTRAVRALLTAP
jgi:[protein-PII] uridylyltransferase